MGRQEAVEEEHPGLGAARRRCHGARDAFYACVDGVTAKGEEPWTRERPVPAPCLALRGAFEAGCRATWVKVSRREPAAVELGRGQGFTDPEVRTGA